MMLIDSPLALRDSAQRWRRSWPRCATCTRSRCCPQSEAWFAQRLDLFNKAYDQTALMAMPWMEGSRHPERWLDQLLAAVRAHDPQLQHTLFELQTVDWRSGQPIRRAAARADPPAAGAGRTTSPGTRMTSSPASLPPMMPARRCPPATSRTRRSDMDMHPLLQVLFQFASLLPDGDGVLLDVGRLYYYFRRERHSRPRNDPPLMVDPPFASLLIPCHNESANLDDTLGAALAQRYPADYEVIAIDDGSSDDTGARLDVLAAKHPRLRCTLTATSARPTRCAWVRWRRSSTWCASTRCWRARAALDDLAPGERQPGRRGDRQSAHPQPLPARTPAGGRVLVDHRHDQARAARVRAHLHHLG